MARILVLAVLGFLFGLATAEIKAEWFEDFDPTKCVENVVNEYVIMADYCKTLHQNDFGEIPKLSVGIPEMDKLIPAITLGVPGWECLLEQLQKNPFVQKFCLTCASQAFIELEFWDKSERLCTCGVYNMILLCKAKA